MRALILLVLTISLAGCRCGGPLQNVEPPLLSVSPSSLLFPPTWVGRSATLSLDLTNSGASTTVSLSVTGPFTLSTSSLTVARGATERVTVRFEPASAGSETGNVIIGDGLVVPITASAMTPPMCLATATCFESSFDFDAAMCVEREKAAGTSCMTNCIVGTCAGPTCVGQRRACDDGDACTIDACDEALGCVTSPRTCQASTNPCLETRCDPQLGCVTTDAPDGLSCGRDDCLATQAEVCIAGACVTRVRPASARCANRWVPVAPEPSGNQLAWDRRRGRVVMLTDSTFTWELTSAAWALRTPLTRPAPILGLVWDSNRQRVVGFNGSEFWEWDGATWAARPATGLPMTFTFHAIAFDERRGRAVVVQAAAQPQRPSETWEWNGSSWNRASMSAPSDTSFLHYDEVRGQVVAPVAGVAWNGQGWQPFATTPAPACAGPWARDSSRHRLVVVCDVTWEWDGSRWSSTASRPPGQRASAQLTFDGTARRTLLFGGQTDDTWAWDGMQWTELIGRTAPPDTGAVASLAWDSHQNRLVLGQRGSGLRAQFWVPDGGQWQALPDAGIAAVNVLRLTPDLDGGLLLLADSDPLVSLPLVTWTWDGSAWARRGATIPSQTSFELMTDQAQRAAVLVSRDRFSMNETWVWNGASWSRASTASVGFPITIGSSTAGPLLLSLFIDGGAGTSSWNGAAWSTVPAPNHPPAILSAMAFDPTRNKTLLYSAGTSTWEWDGTDWRESLIEDTPRNGASQPSMAFDEANQRMTLWTGSLWVLLR